MMHAPFTHQTCTYQGWPRFALVGAIAFVFVGCSMLGRQTDFADAVTSSGVGPFRPLAPEELGGGGALIGLRGVGRASEIPGALFFDLGGAFEAAQEGDEGEEIAPDLFRARPHELGCASYRGMELALSPKEAWEGARLFDPFVYAESDGSLELYYAGEGGIGLARAADDRAAFSRVGDGLILEGARRSPSVIRDDALGEILYFEETGRIYAARREGEFTLADEEPIVDLFPGGSDDPLDDEIRHASPFAIVGEMPSGRRTVRLYFVSIRAGGDRHLMMAASEDGVRFERSPFPVVNLKPASAGAPSVRLDEDGVTHLFYIEDVAQGQLMRAVSPLETWFFGHPEIDSSACDE